MYLFVANYMLYSWECCKINLINFPGFNLERKACSLIVEFDEALTGLFISLCHIKNRYMYQIRRDKYK